MRNAIGSGIANSWESLGAGFNSDFGLQTKSLDFPSSSDFPTVYRVGHYVAGSSGKSIRKGNPRKRRPLRKRGPKVVKKVALSDSVHRKLGFTVGQIEKRKAEGEIEDGVHVAQRLKSLAVPIEGLSKK